MKTSEILRKGRAILERNGLNKGYYYDREQAAEDGTPPAECRVCGLGALRIAIGGTPGGDFTFGTDDRSQYAAFLTASELLADVACTTYYPGWNDERERTVGEVLALFDEAIELAEANETAVAL